MSLSHIALAAAATSSLAGPGDRDHFAERMLQAHNAPRAALSLPPLRWDPRLAADAAAWAGRLAADHRFDHEDQQGEGENLWRGTAGAFAYEQMVQGWTDERIHYVHGRFPQVSRTGSWHDVGHYTQMVWRNTGALGCAIASDRRWDYLVCRYDPPGNWIGEQAY